LPTFTPSKGALAKQSACIILFLFDGTQANAEYDSYGPSGLLNMSHLSGGAEVFASKPHFLDGHPW